MIQIDPKTKDALIRLSREKNLYIEGNILKVLDVPEEDKEFKQYVRVAIERDHENRRKRLEVTKEIQLKNRELSQWKEQNEIIKQQLEDAVENARTANQKAQNDLEVLQKKTQYELIGKIVRVSLFIICAVGLITSILFAIVLFSDIENKTVESSWSNIFSILLTNSFSIVGTIMGVKYANEKIQNPSNSEKKIK